MATANPRERSIATTPKLGKTVLVIDDSKDILDLQTIVLTLSGYNVLTAQSCGEAYRLLKKTEEPDLILLDIQLDDMRGTEFLKLLERKIPSLVKHVPIVFISGERDEPKSKAAGFISKPIDAINFISSVRKFIEMGRNAPYKH